ncbi:MAG: DUF115 domain-containing protein [Treponema sp.]|nr:DUF115 domain-containing protein [Treponema sp.]
MSPWEKNYISLKKHYPALAQKLSERCFSPSVTVQMEQTPSGNPTLILNGIAVHSKRDPVHEALRVVTTLGKEGAIILLGFGLGYGAEVLARIFPERPLIIVERYEELLYYTLQTRDIHQFLEGPPVIFVLGGESDAIIWALQAVHQSKSDIVKNPALVRIDEQWYQAVEQQILTWFSKEAINRATTKRFGERWVRNLSRNVTLIRDKPGVKHLRAILNNTFPTLVVAAGPSLDSLRSLLPALAERCLIVAVDTAFRFVLRAGLTPDFVVVVDPQYWNARHLDYCSSLENSSLITESAVYPSVLNRLWPHIFVRSSLFPLGAFLENRVDQKGTLASGGSVATTAWDFARLLGSSAIYCAGLDLSFPQLKTHFRGAFFEERAHNGSNRFFPIETASVHTLCDGFPFFAPSVDGSSVLTDKRLSIYATWFEHRIRLFPQPPTYRIGSEGIRIHGMHTVQVEHLLALPPCRDALKTLLQRTFDTVERDFNAEQPIRNAQYSDALHKLMSGLKEITQASAQATHSIEQFRTGSMLNREQIVKKLDRTAQIIKESAVTDVAGFLFPDSEPEYTATTPFDRYLESSYYVYSNLHRTGDAMIECLNFNHLTLSLL